MSMYIFPYIKNITMNIFINMEILAMNIFKIIKTGEFVPVMR